MVDQAGQVGRRPLQARVAQVKYGNGHIPDSLTRWQGLEAASPKKPGFCAGKRPTKSFSATVPNGPSRRQPIPSAAPIPPTPAGRRQRRSSCPSPPTANARPLATARIKDPQRTFERMRRAPQQHGVPLSDRPADVRHQRRRLFQEDADQVQQQGFVAPAASRAADQLINSSWPVRSSVISSVPRQARRETVSFAVPATAACRTRTFRSASM